jgi:hypothetical protein
MSRRFLWCIGPKIIARLPDIPEEKILDRYKRDKLAALAIAGLRATPNEKWSYIFDGPDCIAISFRGWEEASEYWGTTEALNLDWDIKRRALIDAGAVEL